MQGLCFDFAVDRIWFPVPEENISQDRKGHIYFTKAKNVQVPIIYMTGTDGVSVIGLAIPVAMVKEKKMILPDIKKAPVPIVDIFLTMALKMLVPNHMKDEDMDDYFPCFFDPLLTIANGTGSCYEKASVMAAVAEANGIKVRIVGNKEPTHFWVEIKDSLTGQWRSLDSNSGYARSKLEGFESNKMVCFDTDLESFLKNAERAACD